MLQHQPCLLPGHPGEELDELRQADAILEIFKQGGDRYAGVAKHPGAAKPQGVLLHG
jgi:hypothetical protein